MVFAALICGMFIKLCTKKLRLPYTPLVTIFGLTIALIDIAAYRGGTSEMSKEELYKASVARQASDAYHFPPPALLFLIFMPALIFESAFNMDWYIFKRQFLKVLLLATVVLVFCMFTTAASCYYILQLS